MSCEALIGQKDLNMEAEGSVALESFTGQLAEKTVHAVL